MILRLLRMFSQFANLERELSAMRVDRDHAWLEVEFHRAQAQQAHQRVVELTNQLVDESHKVADTMSLHAIGKRVYSKADPLPPDYKPVAGSVTTRVIPSQVSRQRMQEIQSRFNEMWDKLPRD